VSFDISRIESAYTRIRESLRRTPLIRSELFERHFGISSPVYFKAENLQYTGSFKARGSLNKILSILPVAREKGVVTASAGNHAQGVAFHAHRLGVRAKIVMPERSPIIKLKSTRSWGAEVILKGDSYQESYDYAVELQKKEGLEFVHAFEDVEVIAGQGSLGIEVLEDCPDIENYFCPIGGGGLLAGSGSYLKAKRPELKIFAIQAEGCSTFLPSLEAGAPVRIEKSDTIAEGMSAKQMGKITFELCRDLVDETILVNDEEISQGVLWLLENEKLFVEGCGGATFAGVIHAAQALKGPSVVVLSGGNLDINMLTRIIERGLVKSGRRIQFEATIPDRPGSLEKLIHLIAEEKASILNVSHERVFGPSSLREVNTHVQVETEGLEHLESLKKRLLSSPWPMRFY